MSAVLMDGKALAAKIKEQVRCQAEQLDRRPVLAVVLVGEDRASQVYINGKKKDCRECGIYSEEYVLHKETTQKELLDLIDVLNGRESIDGILVEFPLPDHIDRREVQLAISPDKDVDCSNPVNVGRLMIGEESFCPCTPMGVMALMEEYGIDPAGKRCVIVSRSNVVGKPQAMLMLRKDATVTLCHTKTQDLRAECLQADILVSAAGQAGLITSDMVKEGAVVIDVGVVRNSEGRLCGDVDYEAVAPKAGYITPVPGGVGPVTRAMLMENTLYAARRHGT